MPSSKHLVDDLTFEILKPEDAEGVTSLVQECYGESYPNELFYDPHTMRELLRQGRLYSVVAKDSAGQVVAHMAMILERPDDVSADNLAGMMTAKYRGSGVLGRLGAAILPVYLRLDLVGLQLYSVTHHLISQRIGIESGAVVCGCLVSDSPGTNADGFPPERRRPIVMQFYPFREPPVRTLYLPERYQRLVSGVFHRLQFPLSLKSSSSGFPEQASLIDAHHNSRRATAYIRFHRLGTDCASQAQRLLADHRECKAFYADIPLHVPCSISAIDQLNNLGWFFGGIIFEREETDFLRLQWTLEPFPDETPVYDEFGREVLEFVRRDRRKCQQARTKLADAGNVHGSGT